ncbi:DNA helicase Pif1-like [Dillenia turbinata]|uniref:DNA helicase Pif1-like n=1 Tax=Dillenia turbinata TaxID=194707 RepID=A0AAN8W6P4_9MAGN
MMHGPCGSANTKAPCMEDGKCKTCFPKQFQPYTTISEDNFPMYRHKDTSAIVIQNGVALDNSRSRAIKYLFKYINKGPNRTKAILEHVDGATYDEIKTFLNCRYLSPYEAAWRIFEFDILENRRSKLIHLPDELYYLLLLLNVVRRAQNYEEIRIVNGVLFRTFKEACQAIALLGDDRECISVGSLFMEDYYNCFTLRVKLSLLSYHLLLDVGDGKTPLAEQVEDTKGNWIKIPNDLLVEGSNNPVATIVETVYPDFINRYAEADYLSGRVIITPT